jgi:hypothetical protein
MAVYLSSCGSWAFVRESNRKPHRYLRVPVCVLGRSCAYPRCRAPKGEPCRDELGRPKTAVHFVRRS